MTKRESRVYYLKRELGQREQSMYKFAALQCSSLNPRGFKGQGSCVARSAQTRATDMRLSEAHGCLITSSKKTIQMHRLFQFLPYKDFLHGRFQATSVVPENEWERFNIIDFCKLVWVNSNTMGCCRVWILFEYVP